MQDIHMKNNKIVILQVLCCISSMYIHILASNPYPRYKYEKKDGKVYIIRKYDDGFFISDTLLWIDL